MKVAYRLVLCFLINMIAGCGLENKNQAIHSKSPDPTVDSAYADSFQLKETFNEDDLPVNDYLTDELKSIRENFRRINSITDWSSVESKELFESTDGGEAKYYYTNDHLEKIVTWHIGESYELLTEYYMMNGRLSFVFEKANKYNRPRFYDTTAMKMNEDTEAFDISKTELIETRSYFEKGKLIHQISNQDCGSPFTNDYLSEEQKRIVTAFEKLINESR